MVYAHVHSIKSLLPLLHVYQLQSQEADEFQTSFGWSGFVSNAGQLTRIFDKDNNISKWLGNAGVPLMIVF